jgi:hypothetical protein
MKLQSLDLDGWSCADPTTNGEKAVRPRSRSGLWDSFFVGLYRVASYGRVLAVGRQVGFLCMVA